MEPKNKYKSLAYITLILITSITIFLAYRTSLLEFNYDFEDFFPKNDIDANFYKEYRKTYGSENDFLIIAIEKEGTFKHDFLTEIQDITKEFKALKNVTRVLSPTELKQPIITSFSFFETPLLHLEDSETLKTDSAIIYNSKEWKNTFFGENRKSLVLLIEHTPQLRGEEAAQLIHQTNKILERHKIYKHYQSGRILAENVFINKMQEELSLFISLSIVLLIFFLWIAYRSAWGILVPLSAVLISIIWTCGIMQLTGYKIDILTVLLPSILFIITISDITHFLSKYLEELRNGANKEHAFLSALKEVSIATFITALTTAVGFITFLNAQMQPIKFFGIYAAVGVFISYIVAFTYMPAIVILLPKPKIASSHNNEHFWYKRLHRLLQWVFQNHKLIIWGSIALCSLSILGILKIQINSTIIDDISDKDHLKKSLYYIENNFGGVRPFELEMNLEPNNPSFFSLETFRKVQKIHEYLEQHYGVNNIISPVSMVSLVHKAQNGGINTFYSVPNSEIELTQILRRLQKEQNRKELRAYFKNKGRKLRISGRVRDEGSMIFDDKNKKFQTFMDSLNNSIPNPILSYHITGSASLVDKNNLQIANDMILDLIIGVLTIGVIIGILFKNVKMAILAIIPNFAPLILIAGIMGACDMNLKASNSIIFSIAFGIAIDDSIHFLSRLKEELAKGKTLFFAIKTTYLSTGKAMLITSLIVISGFCTMIFSDFGGTFYMGLLVSLTLVFAIAFDFLLMPALLINFFNKKRK